MLGVERNLPRLELKIALIKQDDELNDELKGTTETKTASGRTIYHPARKDDEHNTDACLVAGTLVELQNGRVSIEDVKVGDLVRTRDGYKSVLAQELTNLNADVYTVVFSDGTELTGTSNHPVFVKGVGFIPLGELQEGHKVYTIVDIATTKLHRLRQLLKPMVWFRNIHGLIELAVWPRLGINQKQVIHGTRNMGSARLVIGQWLKWSVNSVARSTRQRIILACPDSVLVNPHGAEQVKLMTSKESAEYVDQSLRSTDIPKQERVAEVVEVSVVRLTPKGKVPVYNLAISEQPEYFANGILVHNCRYACLAMLAATPIESSAGELVGLGWAGISGEDPWRPPWG